jgi:hypothetical protein
MSGSLVKVRCWDGWVLVVGSVYVAFKDSFCGCRGP